MDQRLKGKIYHCRLFSKNANLSFPLKSTQVSLQSPTFAVPMSIKLLLDLLRTKTTLKQFSELPEAENCPQILPTSKTFKNCLLCCRDKSLRIKILSHPASLQSLSSLIKCLLRGEIFLVLLLVSFYLTNLNQVADINKLSDVSGSTKYIITSSVSHNGSFKPCRLPSHRLKTLAILKMGTRIFRFRPIWSSRHLFKD